MTARHGSQCGFCTPGIVMALYAARLNHSAEGGAIDRQSLSDALAGNLCRCTGYGPIYAAAEDAFAEPLPPADRAARAADAKALCDMRVDRRALRLEAAEGVFDAPRTLDDAAALAAAYPEATIVAGATDVGLWVTKALRRLPHVLYLGQVADLRQIDETPDGGLVIGAMATYAEAEPVLSARWPDFGELLRRLGSTQVRATGTIGGNIANGSPIGDSPPALIALGARLRLRHGDAVREIPLEDFFLQYGEQDRQLGELVTHIVIPPNAGPALGCYKISKRFDQDISAICAAFSVTVEVGVVSAARLAFGGMAGVPKRASAAEAALVGQPWSLATATAAGQALAQDFTPLDDLRASSRYRLTAAANLLVKYAMETGAAGAPAAATRLVGRGAAFA